MGRGEPRKGRRLAGPLSLLPTGLLPLGRLDDRTWDLPVTLDLCSGLRSLWGGCGLGAAVLVAEQASGRPCRWATVQYLRPIHPGQVLRLSVGGRDGRTLSQTQVSGTVDGEPVLAGLAALGGDGETDLQPVRPPEDAPPPEDCARAACPCGSTPSARSSPASSSAGPRPRERCARTAREARAGPACGPAARAVRRRPAGPRDARRPRTVGDQRGPREHAGCVSLDNTVRYARTGAVEPGGWVLIDLTVEAVVADVAQLKARLFDPAGTLLAVAEQSAVVRRRAEPPAGG